MEVLHIKLNDNNNNNSTGNDKAEHSFCGVAISMTIDAHKLHNRSCDRNEDCLIVAMRVANPLLRVLSMIIRTICPLSLNRYLCLS